MTKFFYLKLALSNIKKNTKLYVPFILSTIFSIAMLYNMATLSSNPTIGLLPRGVIVETVLNLGFIVVNVFVFIFVFYTYSFIIKRRQNEFGLFMILGMEKKHLFRMVLIENILLFAITVFAGSLIGISLHKLVFMTLIKITNLHVVLEAFISPRGLVNCAIMMGIIFFLILVFTIKQIQFTKPVDLLKSTKQGEKEPKSKWISAFLGLACIISGYLLACTIKDPIEALVYFFLAVILVIIGTYLCFTSFSIILLKLLRKNKSYYYKPTHFLNISTMIYRMKQNAVGLANICILSIMVIIMLSSTSALWFGLSESLDASHPSEIQIISKNSTQVELVNNAVSLTNDKYNLTPLSYQSVTYLSHWGSLDNDTFKFIDLHAEPDSLIILMELKEYNRLSKQVNTLDENEVILYNTNSAYTTDTLRFLDYQFNVRQVNAVDFHTSIKIPHLNKLYVVLPSSISLEDVITKINRDISINYEVSYNLASGYDAEAYVSTMKSSLDDSSIIVTSKELTRYNQLTFNGSFFFLGIFLSILFIIATTIIVFYKQISEGFEDKSRFDIMQKVGLSNELIKKTINSQTLTIFFLPIFVALIHTFFAFPFINKILSIFNISGPILFKTTLLSFAIFGAFYYVVYKLTARQYYKIVRNK